MSLDQNLKRVVEEMQEFIDENDRKREIESYLQKKYDNSSVTIVKSDKLKDKLKERKSEKCQSYRLISFESSE